MNDLKKKSISLSEDNRDCVDDQSISLDFQNEIKELKKINSNLSEQVKNLIKTESSLYEAQENLDIQMNIYRKLNELGTVFNNAKDLNDIFSESIKFVEYGLQFERSMFFIKTDQDDVFNCVRHSGFYDFKDKSILDRYTIDDSDPIVKILHEKNFLISNAQTESREGQFLTKGLDLKEWILVPLKQNEHSEMGILLAGNSERGTQFNSRVAANNHFHVGLANLANQAAIAINNIRNYKDLLVERELLEQKVQERTKELSKANDEMKRLDTLKTQFFANVSHELRTPLTLSLGPVDFLLNQFEIKKEGKDQLRIVNNNLLRLYKLINELLDFSKLEAGKMNAKFKEKDIVPLIKYYFGHLEAAAKRRGITLRFNANSESSKVYVDIEKIEKAFMNLLSNAFKFTPDQGNIEIKIVDTDKMVSVSVIDDGIGISSESQIKIFDRFAQADGSETRKYSGTGIGLSLVKEYADLHKANIELISEVGKGSQFIIYFQKGKDHFSADQIDSDGTDDVLSLASYELLQFYEDEYGDSSGLEEESLDIIDNTADELPVKNDRPHDDNIVNLLLQNESKQKKKVLLVEDNIDMRRYIQSILQKEYIVVTAKDGQDGLERARVVKPDLILSDVMMPRMSGYELCLAIKSEPTELRRVPVILLTAKAEQSNRIEGLKSGADDYLLKPFNAEELWLRVRNLIQIRSYEKRLVDVNKELSSINQQLVTANNKIMSQQAAMIHHSKMSLLGEITASVSHEISTPLVSISSTMTWIQTQLESYFEELESTLSVNQEKTGDFKSRLKRRFEISYAAIERIRNHIHKMKSYIRFQEKSFDFFDLKQELETTLYIVNFMKPAQSDVILECEPDVPKVFGRAADINQLVTNLVVNALQALPKEKQGHVWIKIGYLSVENKVFLEIKDDGSGMSEDVRSQLFKRVYTTKDDGTGVGLYLCNEIIQQHNLSVEVESELGKGSRFRVYFHDKQIKNSFKKAGF